MCNNIYVLLSRYMVFTRILCVYFFIYINRVKVGQYKLIKLNEKHVK